MERVKFIQTFDKILHQDIVTARRHLDKLYGETVNRLAAKAISDTEFKYSKLIEFIDRNLDEFVFLNTIKQDMVMEEEYPEDD